MGYLGIFVQSPILKVIGIIVVGLKLSIPTAVQLSPVSLQVTACNAALAPVATVGMVLLIVQ